MGEYIDFYYNYGSILQQSTYVCYSTDTKGFFRANTCENQNKLMFCGNPCKHVLQENQVTNMYSNNDGYVVSSSVAGSYFFFLQPFSKVVFDLSLLSGPYKANFYVRSSENKFIMGIETKMGEKVEVSRTCSDSIDPLYRFNQTVLIIIFSRVPGYFIGGNFSTSAMTTFSCPPTLSPTVLPSPLSTDLPTPGSSIPTMPAKFTQYPTLTAAPTYYNPTMKPVISVIATVTGTAAPAIIAAPSAAPVLPRRRLPTRSPSMIHTNRNMSSLLRSPTPSKMPSATAGPSISSANDAASQSVNSNIIILIAVMIPIFLLVSFIAAGMIYCRKIMHNHNAGAVAMILPIPAETSAPPIPATATAAVETVAYASVAAAEDDGPGSFQLFSRNRNKVAIASITDDDNLPIAELYTQNNDNTSHVNVLPSATIIEMI